MSDGWKKFRERKFGLLWFGETASDGWSITDPASKELGEACHRLRYGLPQPTNDAEKQFRSDVYRVLRVVDDYQHLTTYELGIEHIVKKLRAIWKAVKAS